MGLIVIGKSDMVLTVPKSSFKQFEKAGWQFIENARKSSKNVNNSVTEHVEAVDEWDAIEAEEEGEKPSESAKNIDTMNATELKRYAVELGIEVNKYSKVGELRRAIKKHVAQKK